MSSPFTDATVRVRVPATSANLGPGFDALGLALTRHDDIAARVVDAGLHIDVRGEGVDGVARDETHLVVRAMQRAFTAMDVDPPGLVVECDNRIPHGRGLGSSAAAIVGGLLLARGLVRDGAARLPEDGLLDAACELEGHPDNVAACLFGGLTIAFTDGAAARAVQLDPDPAIVPVVLIPPFAASTELARGLLPATVSHADAAFAAGRSALLVAALTGAPEALLAATEDRLHQAYRAPAMPDSAELVGALRRCGHAAVISGAGPTVLVLARGQVEAEAVRTATPQHWTSAVLAVDAPGAHVVTDARS